MMQTLQCLRISLAAACVASTLACVLACVCSQHKVEFTKSGLFYRDLYSNSIAKDTSMHQHEKGFRARVWV